LDILTHCCVIDVERKVGGYVLICHSDLDFDLSVGFLGWLVVMKLFGIWLEVELMNKMIFRR